MADFEDANSPTWTNVVEGQANLIDAVERHDRARRAGRARQYRLDDEIATLLVRPRGWHLPETHVPIGGRAGLREPLRLRPLLLPQRRRLLERGTGPYFYLPKLESHLEARLWNDVFRFAEEQLGLAARHDQGHRPHRDDPRRLRDGRDPLGAARALRRPQRGPLGLHLQLHQEVPRARPSSCSPTAQVTMTVPFMRAYAQLLVKTCHRRGAHAMGGMAAFIPSRRDPELNERALAKVREDKQREAGDGFDGTWVAHPDLVPIARAEFDECSATAPNQLERQRDGRVGRARTSCSTSRPRPARSPRTGCATNVDVGAPLPRRVARRHRRGRRSTT